MKKKQKKTKRTKFNQDDYERYNYGPLTLERHGRQVAITSNWEPKAHKEYLAEIKVNHGKFKSDIDSKIKDLINIASNHNPLELLSAIAPENIFTNPEEYDETTHEGKESYVEYALSIALSVKEPKMYAHATEEAIKDFKRLISEIFNDLTWYFATDNLDEDRTKAEIRFKSLLNYLMLRGDSYAHHHLDLTKELFEPHNSFFSKHYNFEIEDFLTWVDEVEKQVLERLKRFIDFSISLKETHQMWVDFIDEKGIESFSSVEESVRLFDLLPEARKKRREIEEKHQKIDEIIFEVAPNKKLPKEFLDLISSKFGENEAFSSFKKTPAWATNDSIIYRKPLIFHNGKYYCFSVQILFRNLITILEALIKEKDEDYFKETYQKQRGNYLVKSSLKFFQNIMPNAQIYENLFYEFEGKRFETDGLIIFDTCIFILEAKAGSFTTPARRGALNRIERDMKYLIDDAYEQAIRTKNFIKNTNIPVFQNDEGKQILSITNKKDIKNVFLVNITLENLGHLASDLNNLKKIDLLKGKEWIWSVFINDLRVISEIIESPSEFLVYLKRRIRANDFPQFKTSDELDFFMYYLNEGLYLENNWLPKDATFGVHGYHTALDRYYHFQEGVVSSGEKPTLKIPEGYKNLVKNIETIGKIGFSEVTTQLLSFDLETMEEILSNIERAKKSSFSDIKDHDFSMTFGLDLGLTFAIISKNPTHSPASFAGYCEMKMYQLKIPKWLLISIDLQDDNEKYDFRVFNKTWGYDKYKENELQRFRDNRLQNKLTVSKKIGRNEICPCGSGKKFKKCCLSRINN